MMAAKLVAYGMSHETVRLLIIYLRDKDERVMLGKHNKGLLLLNKTVKLNIDKK